ncbi:hypothetical protein [Phormidium sp. CCY1219]|jgi:hypothetical protein|uniref:hypothetical protein n=1 Tax=Phormidium sp. CCY1219 TaxID=2886104 RepID=UPI002D1F776E|nr:hypothetical protein [Phormidium sp. CCY1219]MEB3826504.1 hypothetical protein [Phormidium sp. CCY1219]
MLKTATFGLLCLFLGAMTGTVSATAEIEPQTPEARVAIATELLAQTSQWSDVTIQLSDLPEGFTAMPASELAELKEELARDDIDVENVFAFVAQQRFQLIMGITTLLQTQQQQEKFDEILRDPQVLRTLIAEEMDTPEDPAEPLDVKRIGDAAGGVRLPVNLEGLMAQLEILAFRQDEMGAFIFVLYREGERPLVEIAEIARQLESRAQAVVSRPN